MPWQKDYRGQSLVREITPLDDKKNRSIVVEEKVEIPDSKRCEIEEG